MNETVRVKPDDLSTSSKELIRKLGLKKSTNCERVSYCPVPSPGPTPYSIAIDLSTMEVTGLFFGVMPNACYCSKGRKILTEGEFRKLKYTIMSHKKTENMESDSKKKYCTSD